MINLNNNYYDNLLEIEGMIKSLVNLFSFPGSDFLNSKIIENDINVLVSNNSNEIYIQKLNDINDIYNSNDLQKLMVEYARLFVGPFQLIAPPYGSFYLDEGRLMGDSTIEVNKFYEKAGLVINESFKDLPDHIIAELEFMIFLIHNEKDFLSKNDMNNFEIILGIRTEFFNNFLKKWIHKFAYRIIENTNSDFYKNVANYLIIIFEMINIRNKEINI